MNLFRASFCFLTLVFATLPHSLGCAGTSRPPEVMFVEPAANGTTPFSVVTVKNGFLDYVDGQVIRPAAQVQRIPAGKRTITLSTNKYGGRVVRTLTHEFAPDTYYTLTLDLSEEPFFGISISAVRPDGRQSPVQVK